MKEKQFHGDYYSPGQGRRPDQYESGSKIFGYSMLIVFAGIVIIALIEIIKNL